MGAANGSASGTDGLAAGEASVTISGRVADGYIKGAVVCVDLNENDACDADEPSALSGDGGSYDLEIPADANDKPIVADIPATATDEDTGAVVGKSMVFIAPGNKPEFLSPITTLVQQELRANPALDVDDAERAVKSTLGLEDESVSLFTDYVAAGENASGGNANAEQFRYLHDTARVVASMMKDIETQVELAAVAQSQDVDDSVTRQAIRDIVRSEIRELLPQIAQQVADIVRNEENTTAEGSSTPETAFDPDQLAVDLRPTDLQENVGERIDAVRERAEFVQADIRQVLSDGVYWMELDCNGQHDADHQMEYQVDQQIDVDMPSNNVVTVDGLEDDSSVEGQVDIGDHYEMTGCKAMYGHAQLSASGESLISETYVLDNENGGWVEELADDSDSRFADYSLLDGQWNAVTSVGPEGAVEFAEDGSAVVSNAEGTMQLKAATQELGGYPVLHHLWDDISDPFWFELVEPEDMFAADSLVHRISVRQQFHPYVMFNHRPYDVAEQDFCAQFAGNCNVVGMLTENQSEPLTSLDAVRRSALQGVELTSFSGGFSRDALMMLNADVSAAGALPSSGKVEWRLPVHESGTDYRPDGTLPTGEKFEGECIVHELPDYTTAADGTVSSTSSVDGTASYTTAADGTVSLERADCDVLSPEDGTVHTVGDSVDVQPVVIDDEVTGTFEQDSNVLFSEWKLIEVQGVQMIEVQLPLQLHHDTDDRTGAAMLLIAHDGFVRMGSRLAQAHIDRVLTYNEAAFTTLLSIVETRSKTIQ
ncbi:MAG: hypothetical protein HKN42_19500 [Granulosicoccus sp.]|nr:hypothetical protein [Granulosicoccus sp.]